jgi:hypothetical protein
MRRLLRILAATAALVAVALWLASGASRGWTKTSVPVKQLDAVTGIEAVTYEKRFVPGVDFLGGALLVAVALAGLSFLFRNQTKPTTNASPTP